MGGDHESRPSWVDGFKKELISELKESLEASLEAKVLERTKHLEDKLRRQDVEITKLENYVRKGNLEFHGVPEKKNEDLEAIVKSIAEKSGTTALRGISLNVYRKGRPSKLPSGTVIPPVIICEARNVLAVDRVMEKMIQRNRGEGSKNASGADVSLGIDLQRVMVRRNYSDGTQYLFRAAKRVAKTKDYKYVWISAGGAVNVRKKEGAERITIHHQDDLRKI